MVQMQKIVGFLDNNLDLLAGIAGFIVGTVITIAGTVGGVSSTTEMGIAFLAASLLYLLFRRKIVTSTGFALPYSITLTLLLNIIFVSTMAASSYLMLSELYRPPLYFFLISLSVAAVTAEILSSRKSSQTWLILVKILLLALSLRYGLLYESPGFIGSDGWLHSTTIETWIANGHITSSVSTLPSGYATYSYFPIMHLVVMATRIITSLNPKDSLFLSVGILNIVSILFVFLIGQRLLDGKGGLLAALFISVCPSHITSGTTLIAQSLGHIFFTVLLFLILRRTSSVAFSLSYIIFSVVLVITHTVSTFVTSIAFVFILVGNKIYTAVTKVPVQRIYLEYNSVILFVVLMIAWWMNSYYQPGGTVFEVLLRGIVNALNMEAEFVGSVIHMPSTSVINRFWFLISIGLIVIGILQWLHQSKRNNVRTAITAGTIVMALITLVFPLFKIENLLPERWLPFIYVIGAGLVVQGIVALSAVFGRGVSQAITLTIVFFVFSMFAINNYTVNTHTPFYAEPGRIGFIQSDLSAVDTIFSKNDSEITTDIDYAELIFRGEKRFADLTYLDPIVEEKGLIIIRKYLSEHPQFVEYFWRKGSATLEETAANFNKFNNRDLYNLVYNNGQVKAYLKTGLSP
jgi:hypothetical protein